MENDSTTVMVKHEKSNAPLICGIIGFVLEIPNLACNILCAASVGVAAGLAAEDGQDFNEKAANDAMDSMVSVMWIGFFLSLLCFIFCFFGKKQSAKVLGIITILASLYLLITSCVFFSIFGLASGILFLVQGIMMIINSKRD